jgi:spore coat polysaccharide biosynthesis protein SpsF
MVQNLRPIKDEDCTLLFKWANDEDVRENSLDSRKIKWKQHKSWFNQKLTSSFSKIFILEYNDLPVGQIRYDLNANGIWDIDYSIDKNYRGLGFGRKMVELSLHKITGEKRAVVQSNNIASRKVFEHLGFEISKSDDEIIEYLYK